VSYFINGCFSGERDFLDLVADLFILAGDLLVVLGVMGDLFFNERGLVVRIYQ
jgi:hypothetical protein